MGLDIRIPIGLIFTLIGALLIISGLVMNRDIYQRSLGININLWWGLVMLAFGVIMLVLGWRGRSAMRPAQSSPEGQAIEAREHREGLESEKAYQEH